VGQNKKPRKKISLIRNKANHINAVLERCLAKFHIIGDMNHLPTAFHFADLSLHLKGGDLKIAQEYAREFLLEKKQPWTMMGIYYFKSDDKVEVSIAVTVKEDVTLEHFGTCGESYIKSMAEQVCKEDLTLQRDELAFYGYYLTYGKDLNIDSVENQLAETFLKTTRSLEEIRPDTITITLERLHNALNIDKFHLVNSEALTTNYRQTA